MMLTETQEVERVERGFKPSFYHRTPAFDILMQDRERGTRRGFAGSDHGGRERFLQGDLTDGERGERGIMKATKPATRSAAC